VTLRIALLGYNGRMGQLIAAEILANHDCKLVGGVVRDVQSVQIPVGLTITANAANIMQQCDVVIDFTTPETAADYVEMAVAFGKPFMTGTTGLNAAQMARIIAASVKIPLLQATNTSLSLAVAAQLTELATRLLRGQGYDTVILDTHHRAKKDAPSGTAKTLAVAVERGDDRIRPDFISVRAGSFVGEHEVMFAGTGETLTIKHSVTDRRIFARGAVHAAQWLHDKSPGYYTMEDVLEI
jgi:4-hydroxy-tetrahydrodipicolinate reductase